MRRTGLLLVAGAAAAAMAASEARAATVIVNPGDSIQTAIDGATAGDTIKILNGRYNQAFTVTKQLKIQGESKTGVILDGAGLGNHVVQLDNGVNSVVVKNLTMLFSDDNGNAIRAHGNDLASFESLVVKGIRATAIEVYGSAATVKSGLFRGNRYKSTYASNADLSFLSNKSYRSGGGLESYAETFAKSNSVEDCGSGMYINNTGATQYLESNSTRRIGWNGLEVYAAEGTVYKGSHKSVAASAVWLDSYSGPGTVNGLSVKKVRIGGVKVYGSGGAVVTLTKLDNCGDGIDVSGSSSSVTACSVKNGGSGIEVTWGDGAVVTGNILKNLLGRGITVNDADGCFVDLNTVTEVGGNEGGAIHVSSSYDAIVSNNIVGDVDGGDGIVVEDNGWIQVGGVVGGYAAGNIVSNCQFAGIRIVTEYDYYYEFGYPEGYYSRVSQNTVVGCGDLDNGGLHLDENTSGLAAYQNNISLSGGSGIHLAYDCDYNYIWGNLVVTSETNGILLDGGTYGWYAGFGNMLVSNVITGSGSEGIDNGGGYTTIANNNISGSGIFDFSNDGSVNYGASTGNTPQPAYWYDVPNARQRDF
jgi:hypothetical protein